jgi:hypothetical protein
LANILPPDTIPVNAMTTAELVSVLEQHPTASLHFVLPSGECVPDHFHVTEVGRVQKSFIDCGGTRRDSAACLIQVWTAADFDHRLSARKLAGILQLAAALPVTPELPVEIEYGAAAAAHYTLSDVSMSPHGLILTLSGKATDCLARERCGVSEDGAVGGCCSSPALPVLDARRESPAAACCG